jgi:nucleotide-binding universal stress UspA family protein
MSLVNRILCPIKLDASSSRLVEIADTLAGHFKAELYLLHVMSTPPYFRGLRFAEEVLDQPSTPHAVWDAALHLMISGHAVDKVKRADALVSSGNVVQNIVDAAVLLEIELIVMGEPSNHRRAAGRSSAKDRLVREVISRVTCPVLTVQRSVEKPPQQEIGLGMVSRQRDLRNVHLSGGHRVVRSK